jgi:hypothetical protein
MRKPHAHPPHVHSNLVLAAWTALCVVAAPHCAQAQSSYAMTKLAQPSGQKNAIISATGIDQQNRAYTTYGFKRMGFDFSVPFIPQWMELSTDSPVQWAASTAASITPTRLLTQNFAIGSITPSGNRLIQGCSRYYDRKTLRVVTMEPTPSAIPQDSGINCESVAGNDAGAFALTLGYWAGFVNTPGVYIPGTYVTDAVARTAAGVSRVLPKLQGYESAGAQAINASGAMAGNVYNKSPYDTSSTAVIWATNDQPFVLPQPVPGLGSQAIAINDKGDAVVVAGSPAPNPTNEYITIRTNRSFHVWRAGVFLPINALNGYDVVGVTGFNNSGAVIGIMAKAGSYNEADLTRYGPWTVSDDNSRAFIWRDGVTKDLAQELKSKGVALTANTTVPKVSGINNQGSLTATLIDPAKNQGQPFAVRLTAKP